MADWGKPLFTLHSDGVQVWDTHGFRRRWADTTYGTQGNRLNGGVCFERI